MRGSVADSLLGLRVRIPTGACMDVSLLCVLLDRGPIARAEECYRLWCVGKPKFEEL